MGTKKRKIPLAKLESFLATCDDTAVKVYGPYAPCKGRSRWRLMVFDPTSNQRQMLTFESEEAAREALPLAAAQVQTHVPLLLHDTIQQYLDYKATLVAALWLRTLGDRLRTFLPNIPLSQLTPRRAEELYKSETQRVGKFGVVKPATHHALLRNTKEFFNWLCEKGLASANPFQAVKPIGRANAGKEQPRETDAKTLDAHLFERARAGEEGALALLVQIYLGLRTSEVLSLTIGAIEREGHKVSIVRGKSKNAKRSLDLYPDVATLLWAHCAGRPIAERVFAANLPKRPKPAWMYKRLHQYCCSAGIPKYCPHSLRGLHATLALENGATSYQVAAGLGHGSFATTAKHYARPSAIDNARSQRVVAVLRGSSASFADEVRKLSDDDRAALLALLQAK
jgi:integrase